MRARPLAIALAVLALVCGGGRAARAASEQPPDRQPLPAFSGSTFDGERISVSELLGRRLVLFFFDATEPEAGPTASTMAEVAGVRGKHNFEMLGIATGAPTSVARGFIATHGLDFPILNDASGAIARRFGLAVPAAILFADAEGYVTGLMGGAKDGGDEAAGAFEAALRQALRLPADEALAEADGRDLLPPFQGIPVDGGDPITPASLRGRPALVMFFLYTCPHCHDALGFLQKHLADLAEDQRPFLVGVSVSGSASTVRGALRERGLAFFPIVLDPDRAIATAFGSFAGVPDLFLVDSEGRITARVQGWREERDPPLLRMQLAKLTGRPVPMLLHGTGYSGNEFCGVCHENQHETWLFTQHAGAFDTLVEHNADRKDECVGCHVVGFGAAGGYTISPATPHLEDVGCESCHGRGGPHLSPGFVVNHDYRTACASCHDPKHSLGFEYAKFLPRVSHAANTALLGLSREERRKRLAGRGRAAGKLLASEAAYVGSGACRECHQAEHETWSRHPHARALQSLESKQKAGASECLPCHTTGYGRKGGFPSGADPAAHGALVGVGCESCHGPGGDHVGENATRVGTILSLGDKCDSCVILRICGSCHDDANDPGFEFEVMEKIEAQRHGTIEPGTGKPLRRTEARGPGWTGP